MLERTTESYRRGRHSLQRTLMVAVTQQVLMVGLNIKRKGRQDWAIVETHRQIITVGALFMS